MIFKSSQYFTIYILIDGVSCQPRMDRKLPPFPKKAHYLLLQQMADTVLEETERHYISQYQTYTSLFDLLFPTIPLLSSR